MPLRLPFMILYISLTTSSAHATAFETHLLEKMGRATTAKEILDLQRTADQLHIARTACRLQLRERIVPYTCYEALQLEIRAGLKVPVQERRLTLKNLDERCAHATAQLRLGRGSTSLLSPTCRRQVQSARAIEQYRRSSALGADFETSSRDVAKTH